MLYYEVTIETNKELTDKIAENCSAENLKDDKQKAILGKPYYFPEISGC